MTQALRPDNEPISASPHPRDGRLPGPAGIMTASLSTRHLLTIADLSDDDIQRIMIRAREYSAHLKTRTAARPILKARTQINLFFEDSTRTNLSFDLAGKKHGADVINVPVAASSVNKNEDMIDTVQTLGAMGADVMIIRAREPRVHRILADRVSCPIINAGDGTIEHPTQALLDAVTLADSFGSLSGLVIAICGDVRHSRVAGSGVRLFQRLGAAVRFIAPEVLLPDDDTFPGVARYTSLQTGLAEVDVVMGLRMQFERMENRHAIDPQTYHETFGLTHNTIRHAKPEVRVMHPGPMNRGIEISAALADDPERSLILSQVFHGVATRMAVLDLIIPRDHDVTGATA